MSNAYRIPLFIFSVLAIYSTLRSLVQNGQLLFVRHVDPITIAVTTAPVAGAATGVTRMEEQVVSDAYSELRKLLAKKIWYQEQSGQSRERVGDNP